MTGAFPAIAMGKCEMCGSDGLLYDVGGVLCCEECQRCFLATTASYMTEDGHIFFLLADGTVTDGDRVFASVAVLKQKHQVTFYRVTIH